jgi:hypothetical protein
MAFCSLAAEEFIAMSQIRPLNDREQILAHSIDQAFSEYELSSQFFFQYLELLSVKGMNRCQFEIYRDNFFFRTASTPRSIFRLLRAAIAHLDSATCRTATENLLDELGWGNLRNSHFRLLETAYNLHAQTVFGIPVLTIADANHSSLICPEAIAFRDTQKNLYKSRAYPTVLGCSFAQELAADQMLRIFYKTLFEPYQNCYDRQDFQQVSCYFMAHINGLEAIHAEQAKQALSRNCQSSIALHLMMQGVTGFLQAQAALWNGILREMQAVQ